MKRLIIACSLIIFSSPAFSAIFKCKNEAGKIEYQDKPCSEGNEVELKNKSTRPDEAVVLASKITHTLLPSPELIEQIRQDLAAIRAYNPYLERIVARPLWIPGNLIILAYPTTYEKLRSGRVRQFRTLNARYGPVEVKGGLPTMHMFLLEFAKPYNIELLAPKYAAIPEIEQALGNHTVDMGIDRDIKIEKVGRYTFWEGNHSWEYSVVDGKMTLIKESYGDGWKPYSSGQECRANLAGQGERAEAVCYDLVYDGWRGPIMVVLPNSLSIDKPFAIGRYEVSVGDWSKYCALSDRCSPESNKDRHNDPQTGITTAQAEEYSQWLSKRTGKTYRIPNRAEWEYAANAGGDQPKKDVNCHLVLDGKMLKGTGIANVRSGPTNGWGLKNYVGNVQEWVEDESGFMAVGGAYSDQHSKCDISLQRPHSGSADEITGFRLLLEMDSKLFPVVNETVHIRLAEDMVSIPGGSFQMGSNDLGVAEKPVHQVKIMPFRLGKYEVTQQQWKSVMDENPSRIKNCGDNCPVENVSWDEVQSFIQKLNQKTTGNYRLPTEAEWEYACRGGGQSQKYCGGNNPGDLAWYKNNSGDKPHIVGQKASNSLGLYDMSGNVNEWTEDCSHSNYNGAISSGDAWTRDGTCRTRMIRGGSWHDNSDDIRSARRSRLSRELRYYLLGFRLAQDN